MNDLHAGWCNTELEMLYRSWPLARLFEHAAERLKAADNGDETLIARLKELAQASRDAGV